jgi:hypothetical protein
MENAQLTLTDIVSVKNLIEAASSRGAFKAHELKAIGELYEKISRFIEATTAQVQEQQAQAQTPQGETNA